MLKKRLFNEKGTDDPKSLGIINSNTTNMLFLADTRYPRVRELLELQWGQFWLPKRVPLVEDKTTYYELSAGEQRFVKKLLSYLTFLDSIQVNHLGIMQEYITEPTIVLNLTVQQQFEAIHSFSYTYMLESVVSPEEIQEVLDEWRNDEIMLERNKFIADMYEEFYDNPTEDRFLKLMFANYLLEAIYFYMGFHGFHVIAKQGKIRGIDEIITLIQKDERLHVEIFAEYMKIFKSEYPEVFERNREVMADMMREAVRQEINFSNHITDGNVLGLNEEVIDQYLKFLSNKRMKRIGLDPIFSEDIKNPLKWADIYESDGAIKDNFFETSVIDYEEGSGLKWD